MLIHIVGMSEIRHAFVRVQEKVESVWWRRSIQRCWCQDMDDIIYGDR